MSNITVEIDDRVRLVTAVLAASEWPDEEQKQLTHAVHPHAKQTRHYVQSYKYHQAVRGVNQALLNGVTLEELFSTALRCEWPTFEPLEPLPHLLKIERWARSLADFEHDTAIAEDFWPTHAAIWEKAVSTLTDIFQNGQVAAFLEKLTKAPIPQSLTVMPNLVYPALTPELATTETTIYLLLPPPKAVGESPPWPYDEDPGWVVAAVCRQLSVRLLAETLAGLERPQRDLFRHAATTLCLEETFDASEGQAYQLRTKKEKNLPGLPQATEQLRAYIQGDLDTLNDVFR